MLTTLILVIIFIALIFDFLNGFHDSANSIATIVSTRVLTPRKAVMWAAFFNLVAAFFFETHIAKTFGKGLVQLEVVNEYVIMAGLLGAIFWNIITWYYGLPTSSSHALMGGYAGAAIAKAGFGAILYAGWIKTIMFIFLAPLMGMIIGFFLMVILMWLFHKRPSSKINGVFRKLQLFSAALYSLGHGTNDAQKTMGIIAAVLAAGGILSYGPNGSLPTIPLWVVLSAHAAIALGTLSGGWRIVKTMGTKITKLKPVQGFCAELSGAMTLFGATLFGIPVSTTHTITGAIVGAGSARRFSAVKWGVASRIVWAWVLTIPAAALIAAGSYFLVLLVEEIVGVVS